MKAKVRWTQDVTEYWEADIEYDSEEELYKILVDMDYLENDPQLVDSHPLYEDEVRSLRVEVPGQPTLEITDEAFQGYKKQLEEKIGKR